MDPQTCTIILLKQKVEPFYTTKGHDEQRARDSTVNILESVFGHVHIEYNLESCLNYINLLPSSSTLIMIEVDDDESTEFQIEMITQTVDRTSESVPVIVCSSNEDTAFMLDCIQAGAADYLLKPLRSDVIKTLFLTLHRQQQQQQQTSLYNKEHLMSLSTSLENNATVIPTSITPIQQQQRQHPAYLPDKIQDRIKALNHKDTNFTKAILETYMIPSSTLVTCKQLTRQDEEILKKRVSDWDFSPLELSHDELIHCTVIILSQVFTNYLSRDQLYGFVIDLSSAYHDENPYHNFAHAVDVLQCIYYFLCQMKLLSLADGSSPKHHHGYGSSNYSILRPGDVFALMIAAIGHDTAHPGVNNAFLINTSAPLALLYNDHSVLESFHAMTLFQLLRKHKFDRALGGTDSKEYNEFRKLVITSILSTDMALHGDYVTKIKEQKQRLTESDPCDWDAARTLEERLLFCSGLIKCADISNVARPFPRAFKWAQILVEEFIFQGDLERELGMPVLPMNDRTKIVLEDSQIGFIKFVAMGLFQSIGDYMQEISFPVDYIKTNLSIWEDRKNKEMMMDSSDANTVVIAQSTTTTVVEDHIKTDTSSNSSSSSTSEDSHTQSTADDYENDYHAHQAVKALNKKEETITGYSTTSTLPRMPATAVAMTSFSHNYTDSKDYNDDMNNAGDWDHRESSGPVYCHCTIQ